MRSPRTTAPLMITLTALAFALTACTASPGATAPSGASTPETTPAAPSDASMMPEPDERHACGQVSALQGILFRSDWEHRQGLIDDVAFASRVAAVEDGWRYLIIGSTDVTPAIKAAQRALTDGGIGYENTEF